MTVLKRILLAPFEFIGAVIAMGITAWAWAKGEKEEGDA
jgi:hypothetical protein